MKLFFFFGLVIINTSFALSELDKYRLLFFHNKYRCETKSYAKNMPALRWDDRLEKVSYCPGLSHNSNRTEQFKLLGGSGYVGENLYWISLVGVPSLNRFVYAIKAFTAEVVNFDRITSCTKETICGCAPDRVCGHYTQVIWASTMFVGCGANRVDCPNRMPKGGLIACNYSPGRNNRDEYAFEDSPVFIETDACKAIRYLPLNVISNIIVSSSPEDVFNLTDGDYNNRWYPALNDTKSLINLTFADPVDIQTFYAYSKKEQHTPNRINVIYRINNIFRPDDKFETKTKSIIQNPILTEKGYRTSFPINLRNIRMISIIFLKRTDIMKISEIELQGGFYDNGLRGGLMLSANENDEYLI